MSTSAINGKIFFKQDVRSYLDANIRSNSLVFDLTNNRLLYSPSGTNYFEFYPGQTSGVSVSGNVDWSNILNEPVASNSTSGLLSVADWNKFNAKADLSAVSGSGSGSVSSVGLSSNTLNVSNSPITSTGTFSVNLSSVISSGTYIKQVVDQYGRTISGTSLSVSDIPGLSAQYIPVGSIVNASTNTTGYLTSSDWNKFNAKADLSAVSGGSGVTSADYFNNPDPIIQIFSNKTTSAALQSITSATEFPFWTVGYRTKLYTLSGPTSGNYQATVVFYGATHSDVAWNSSNTISATITSAYNVVSEFYTNKFTKWSAQLFIDSGTVPAPGISASVEA